MPPKVGPMDKAHVMDWPVLDLGHGIASKRTVHLADLDAHVWGLEEMKDSTLPVALLILSHGWANKAREMEHMASGLIGEMRALEKTTGRRRTRDLVVATLDQRNHGERRRIREKNTFTDNPMRLIHSATNISGGVMDNKYVANLLPAYLWPESERVVEEIMVSGFSMGGHVAWRMLREDKRINIGVLIGSLPSEALGANLLARADSMPYSPPAWCPPEIRQYFQEPTPPGTYSGKKILAIYGGLDAISPISAGERQLDAIAKEAQVLERIVQEDRGHVVSEEMVRWTAEWFWRYGLSVDK